MAINALALAGDGKTSSAWREFLKAWVTQSGRGAVYWNTDGGSYANPAVYIASRWRDQPCPEWITNNDVRSEYYNVVFGQTTNAQWKAATAAVNVAGRWQTDCIGIMNAWLVWSTNVDAWRNGVYSIRPEWQPNGWQVTQAAIGASQMHYYGDTWTANCQGYCRLLNSIGMLNTMDTFPFDDKPKIVFSGSEARIYNWGERLSDDIGHSGYYIGTSAASWGTAYYGDVSIVESTSMNNSSYNYAQSQLVSGNLKMRYGVQLCGYNNGSAYVQQTCKDGQTRAVRQLRSSNGGIWSYWAYIPFVVEDVFMPWVIMRRKRLKGVRNVYIK